MSGKVVKLCVAGSGAVGKSALCIRFVRSRFVDTYDPTVEDIFRKPCEIDGEARVLEIIDTAGQEEYRTLREIYFQEAHGFLVVYSIANKNSFAEAQRIKDKLTRMHGDDKPIVLVGNKSDLEDEREVPENDAYEYAVAEKVGFFETSAKTMTNVTESFHGLVRLVDRWVKKHPEAAGEEDEDDADGAGGKGGGGGGGKGEGKGGKKRRKKKACALM